MFRGEHKTILHQIFKLKIMTKVPFSYTFVLYDKGDIISMFFALLSLAPVFAMCVYTFFSIFEGGKKRILVCVLVKCIF